MLLIRRFEEKVEERFRAGDLAGFLHVAIGQEAVAVGVCRALEDGDVIASTHRAHAHALRPGHAPERAHGGALRQGRRMQPRLRRLDAPVRRRARAHRRQRRRRRRAPCDHGRRAVVQAARRAARRGRVLRRRRDEHRHVPRVAQPRTALEGARHLRLREQRLRGVDSRLAAAPDRGSLASAPSPSACTRSSSTARTSRRSTEAARRRDRVRARRGEGPRVPAREHVPADRPLRRRPAGLPGPRGGARGAPDAGSDRQAAREGRHLGRGVGRARARGRRDRGGLGRVRAERHRPAARRRAEEHLRLQIARGRSPVTAYRGASGA